MKFETEAELCARFIELVSDEWTVYPETCGYDMVLVHKVTEYQLAVEAKLTLNAKVLSQIMPSSRFVEKTGPDFRAILVPAGKTGGLSDIIKHLGITVLAVHGLTSYRRGADGNHESYIKGYYLNGGGLPKFLEITPDNVENKSWYMYDDWVDWCPVERLELPIVVPDVACGVPSPLTLSPWKIKAIQLIVILDKFGTVTSQDFNDLNLSQSRWSQQHWLEKADLRGHWKRCENTPDLKAEHPKNFDEIKALINDWLPENRKTDKTRNRK